ncbi:hypothetical protein [Alicyclobacillus fastidiosus]|nr:hypothetical protein [Alicyclobacillus fastidiosus]
MMTEAMEQVDGEAITVLRDSYRSRVSLVEFVNAVFLPVFEATGLERGQVELKPIRKDKEGQACSLEVWLYPDSNKRAPDPDALALGIEGFLAL